MVSIGNDQIHIVWSENFKKYDVNSVRTQFADFVICIYPQKYSLYQIEITKKKTIGELNYGPLFDSALVDESDLTEFVLATVVSISKRLKKLTP
ncbi:MAG: Ral GTPase-activating protein subunit alpha-1, partial [Paramarteilia canceri]